MATVSYTIHSHYDPPEYKSFTHDTSQSPDETDPSESWQFDQAFRPPPPPPPRFVPATLPAPDWDFTNARASSSLLDQSTATDLSNWYRSVTSNRPEHPQPKSPSPRLGKESEPTHLLPSDTMPLEKRNKNNWFIMNAIRSDPAPQHTRNTSSPTLADIIARDPPPLPAEERFKPPVWLEIGPANKGFVMLQRSGWSEGEPLGPDVVRRPTLGSHRDMILLDEKRKWEAYVKQETLEVSLAGYDDVAEMRRIDVLDLTLSDSDDESEDDLRHSAGEVKTNLIHPPTTARTNGLKESHGRTALLTPIATVLKSDRLGIGLKAKTVGSYKASQKRVTHNAAAMAAHIRAAEASRRLKHQYGRGRRGFTVQRKQEETDRKKLLAYMNG